jgi:hypothetical protein
MKIHQKKFKDYVLINVSFNVHQGGGGLKEVEDTYKWLKKDFSQANKNPNKCLAKIPFVMSQSRL